MGKNTNQKIKKRGLGELWGTWLRNEEVVIYFADHSTRFKACVSVDSAPQTGGQLRDDKNWMSVHKTLISYMGFAEVGRH